MSTFPVFVLVDTFQSAPVLSWTGIACGSITGRYVNQEVWEYMESVEIIMDQKLPPLPLFLSRIDIRESLVTRLNDTIRAS